MPHSDTESTLPPSTTALGEPPGIHGWHPRLATKAAKPNQIPPTSNRLAARADSHSWEPSRQAPTPCSCPTERWAALQRAPAGSPDQLHTGICSPPAAACLPSAQYHCTPTPKAQTPAEEQTWTHQPSPSRGAAAQPAREQAITAALAHRKSTGAHQHTLR